MNITSVSNPLFTSATSNVQPGSGMPSGDPDGAGDVGRVHHGKGGGHMRQAVAQALQSLGLNLAQPGAASSSSSSSSASTDSSGSSSDDGKVKNDLRQFMHQLFQAVKTQGGSSDGSDAAGAGASADPRSGFASGLSSLISQVSNGSAPADLQSAFTQLASDLSSQASTGSSAASSGDASSAATLQAFLTQLQQTLGYSSSSSSNNGATATGALLTTQV
jgi:hypothetical protein